MHESENRRNQRDLSVYASIFHATRGFDVFLKEKGREREKNSVSFDSHLSYETIYTQTTFG